MEEIPMYNRPRLMNIAAASDYLGMKTHAFKHQFYGRSNKTEPTPTLIGNRIYFTPESLDSFVMKHTQGVHDGKS